MSMMRVQVKQWGNSKAVRLPKDFANSINLNTGDFLDVEKVAEDKFLLVIVPNVKKQKTRLTLSERIAMTSTSRLEICDDWDLIEPVGKEIE